MVVEQSLLAGINGGHFLSLPITQTRHRFIAVVIAAFARLIAARTAHDYETVHTRIMALPDELADYLETPDGWAVLAMITSSDNDFRPVVH